MSKIKTEKGSMAIYVTVTLVTMLLIAMAIFMVTVAKNKEQMQVSLKIKEAYEEDNARAAEIYASLTGTGRRYGNSRRTRRTKLHYRWLSLIL